MSSASAVEGRRVAQKRRTRERLLDAATAVFTTRGLGASLDDVAEAAGLTKGAVYSNFESKEALISELLAHRWSNRARSIESATDAAGSAGRTAVAGRLVMDAAAAERDAFLLDLELSVYLARHPDRAPVAARPTLYEEVAEILRHRADERPLPLPAEDLAIGLVALGRGLALAQLTDPSVPDDLFGRWLDLVLRGQPPGR